MKNNSLVSLGQSFGCQKILKLYYSSFYSLFLKIGHFFLMISSVFFSFFVLKDNLFPQFILKDFRVFVLFLRLPLLAHFEGILKALQRDKCDAEADLEMATLLNFHPLDSIRKKNQEKKIASMRQTR